MLSTCLGSCMCVTCVIVCVVEISHTVDLSWVLYVCDLCYCMCVTCVVEISHTVDLSRVLYVCDLCYRNITHCRPVSGLVCVWLVLLYMCVPCVLEISYAVDLSWILYLCDLSYCMVQLDLNFEHMRGKHACVHFVVRHEYFSKLCISVDNCTGTLRVYTHACVTSACMFIDIFART